MGTGGRRRIADDAGEDAVQVGRDERRMMPGVLGGPTTASPGGVQPGP